MVNIFLSFVFFVSLMFSLVISNMTSIAGEKMAAIQREKDETIKYKEYLLSDISAKTSSSSIFSSIEARNFKKVSSESYSLPALALR